jgi:hypothetical protein
MAITDNINAVIRKILDERNSSPKGESQTADDVQRDAQAAIRAGQGQPETGQVTPAWETYMGRFAADATQLRRLNGTDGTHGNNEMQKERAYLVSNGMCGAGTTDDLLNGNVTDNLE